MRCVCGPMLCAVEWVWNCGVERESVCVVGRECDEGSDWVCMVGNEC